jgi:hypothetical protein
MLPTDAGARSEWHRGGLPGMLEQDRKRAGWSVGQASWRLGVSASAYRKLEVGARSATFETWDRICKAFGWPQTFVGREGRRA